MERARQELLAADVSSRPRGKSFGADSEEKDTASAYTSNIDDRSMDDVSEYTASVGKGLHTSASSVVSAVTKDSVATPSAKEDLIKEIKRLERLAKAHAAATSTAAAPRR